MKNTTRTMPVPVTSQALEPLIDPEMAAPEAGAVNATLGPI
jgi:hypothetical protein